MTAALGSYAEARWAAKRLFDVYTDQDGISWPSMEGRFIAAVHVVVAALPLPLKGPALGFAPLHRHLKLASRHRHHRCLRVLDQQQHLYIRTGTLWAFAIVLGRTGTRVNIIHNIRSTSSCASVPALSSYSTAWIWLGDKRPTSLHYCHANLF